jgi:hypothetical protein
MLLGVELVAGRDGVAEGRGLGVQPRRTNARQERRSTRRVGMAWRRSWIGRDPAFPVGMAGSSVGWEVLKLDLGRCDAL